MSQLRSVRGAVVAMCLFGAGGALAQSSTPPAATAAPTPAEAPAKTVAPATPAAAAAPAPKKSLAPAVRAESMSIAAEKLARAEDAAVRDGLAALAAIGGEPAAQLVITRVRKGLPPQLIEAAIDTLVMLGRPSAANALLELVLHARAAVRERAIMALGALKARSAQSALLFALDDPNPQVRAAAVSSLGTVGDARALSALYVAADRGIEGALVSIGMIAKTNDLKALLARAPHADVTTLKPALSTIMARKDFPLEGKLRVVRELSKLGSASARVCLVEWLDAYKADAPTNLRKALFDAIKHIDELQAAKQNVKVETTGGKT